MNGLAATLLPTGHNVGYCFAWSLPSAAAKQPSRILIWLVRCFAAAKSTCARWLGQGLRPCYYGTAELSLRKMSSAHLIFREAKLRTQQRSCCHKAARRAAPKGGEASFPAGIRRLHYGAGAPYGAPAPTQAYGPTGHMPQLLRRWLRHLLFSEAKLRKQKLRFCRNYGNCCAIALGYAGLAAALGPLRAPGLLTNLRQWATPIAFLKNSITSFARVEFFRDKIARNFIE